MNRIWRTGKGRTYKDKTAKAYGEAVAAYCLAHRVKLAFPEGVRVAYTLTWYRGRKAGDLSNRVKVVEDALNGIVWADDGQIVEVHLYRVDATKATARVELSITEAE